MDSSRRNILWAAGALAPALGWVAGYFFWRPESPGSEFGSYFDLFLPFVTLVVGGPLAIGAGLLLGRQGPARLVGYALLGLTGLTLAYLSSFAFFGGICLDPGEVCVTTWLSRITELGCSIACFAAGRVVHGWASR